MLNGIINVYKDSGYTSFDVVALLRGMLKVKKIGHTGTLDPEAVGVLPVCIGPATKICDQLMEDKKEYIGILRLGITTDTQDTSGEILSLDEENAKKLSREEISEKIRGFIGRIEQLPPMYSAVKVNGKKLVDLARKGVEVERKPREATIDSIDILCILKESEDDEGIEYLENGINVADGNQKIYIPYIGNNGLHNKDALRVFIKVKCSKGTYIRTLCEDIGRALGCGGSMEGLVRIRTGEFGLDKALSLSKIQKIVDKVKREYSGREDIEAKDVKIDAEKLWEYEEIQSLLIPIDTVFERYPSLHITEEGQKALDNGNQLKCELVTEYKNNEVMLTGRKKYRVYNYVNQFWGVYEYHSGWKVLKAVKIFAN